MHVFRFARRRLYGGSATSLLDEHATDCLPSKARWSVLYVNAFLRPDKTFRHRDGYCFGFVSKRFSCWWARVQNRDKDGQLLCT